MAGKQSVGTCMFCGREMAKAGLTRHLKTCEKRQESIEQANQASDACRSLVHLQVRDTYYPDFWLHLEMNGDASLKELDAYLRAIWLECCGHLSRFSAGSWGSTEIPMSWKINRAFSPDLELTHIYDFGSSSETLIKQIGEREGVSLTKHPVFLMARNKMPPASCRECGEPATHYCVECLIEDNEWSNLCERHVAEHPHRNYGEPMRLVNSPRLGICGYDGPAEPPY